MLWCILPISLSWAAMGSLERIREMRSWAKVIKEGSKLGFEFWGRIGESNPIRIYRYNQLVGNVNGFKEARKIVLEALCAKDLQVLNEWSRK